ncbi:MAG: autotransporter-associated beta strand repeat-containing protein, partial [Kiritimatiellaeota bacterium]|nr:autotransporter-associated beta strand repeat-containing protein [Kiritimatiellota bacterium]
MAGAQTVTFAADTVLTTGLTFNYAGNQALTLDAAAAGTNTVTLAGDVGLNTGGGTSANVTIGNAANHLNVDLGGLTRTMTVAASRTLTLVDVVSNGGIIKSGAGTLTLNGANTYTGGMTISAGTVIAGNANALGTAGTITLGDASSGANAITLSYGGNTINRPITVANYGGTVTLGRGNFTGAITLNKNVVLGYIDSASFTGGISGTGDVTIPSLGGWAIGFVNVSGGGTANTFNGNLYIVTGGVLNLGGGWSSSNKAIPDTATVNVVGTLNIAIGGNNETIDALTGSGSVNFGGNPDTLTI